MKIEIITTGDEVMQGIIVDTNSAWIASRCAALGHEIVRHTSVGDDFDSIGDALKRAASSAECVIVTGGLGPTADDMTVEAAAKTFGAPLVRDESVISEIRAFFERVGRPMSKSNDKQALIPKGGAVLQNRVGTAPGIRVELAGATFFFLPGVPKELYQIVDDSVMPWLRARALGAYADKVLRCFGMPEASIDEKLRGVELSGARLSFRVFFPEILLKLISRAGNEDEARSTVARAEAAIRERLGDVVYADGETTLAAVVGGMLKKRGMTLAVAESCTGGLIASLITDVSGASEWFERGAVTYSNRSKVEILGVPEETIREHGAVSKETAAAMADGIRRKSGATVGIGVTGIAGPDGGTAAKPVGTVHIAVATPDGTHVQSHCFQRDRIWFKQMVAATALDTVRKYLLSTQEA
ncbi:MAG: competence/damage-inducible protein A [bacterium]